MSYLKLPGPEDLSGKTKELIEDCINRWGYAPNIVRAYSLAPEVMEAEDVWSKGVMHTGFLPRKLKEGIATVVSAANTCNYCASSHAHAYTLAGGDEQEGQACRLLDFSEFDAKDSAAFEFARKATPDANAITKADIEKLQEHYTDGEIVEIATVIQQFMGYNWFVTMLGLELEEDNPIKNLESIG